MVGDASLHNGQRWDRLHKARVKEEEELQATGPGGPSDGARFSETPTRTCMAQMGRLPPCRTEWEGGSSIMTVEREQP